MSDIRLDFRWYHILLVIVLLPYLLPRLLWNIWKGRG